MHRSRAQAELEAGDLIEAVAHGCSTGVDVHELQDVVAGALPGRANEADITLFKSNGLAAWDLAAAARAVELAERGRPDLWLLARGDDVVAERVHDVGPVEQAPDLLGRAAVRHVVVLEDLGERPAAVVLADHVLRDPLLTSATATTGTRTRP